MELPWPFNMFLDLRTDEEKAEDRKKLYKTAAIVILAIALLVILLAALWRLGKYIAGTQAQNVQVVSKLAPLMV